VTGAVALLFAAWLHFFCASLIAFCSVPGGAVLCAVFLVVAGGLGHLHRVTLREPFLALGALLAALAALALAPTREHRVILLVVGPLAVLGMLLLGHLAVRADLLRAQVTRLRAAIQAQVLLEQGREAERLTGTLEGVLGRNHDVSNMVMSAALNSEALVRLLAAEPGKQDPAELREIAQDLLSSLRRIKAQVEDAKRVGRERARAVLHDVVVAPVAEEVREQLGAQHPRVDIMLRGEDDVVACVAGGEEALRGLLEELVRNACEGAGGFVATSVEVSWHAQPPAAVKILVRDNGPGFRPEELEGVITPLETTKPGALGLGLYTAEKRVRASGGLLVRRNVPEGGALVEVVLPRGQQA
ncbi:MAG: HAMP domain-containing sensor histidine kinase, partial [Myxococcota bacterium]